MKIDEVKAALKGRKGANLRASWNRKLKTRKGVTAVVSKQVVAVVRGGVDYDHIETVKEARASGELPSENAGLPWGRWVEFPIHIEHKGTDYVRMYPASGIEFKPKTVYFCDGMPCQKEFIEGLCLASEFSREDENPTCFTIKLENLETLG